MFAAQDGVFRGDGAEHRHPDRRTVECPCLRRQSIPKDSERNQHDRCCDHHAYSSSFIAPGVPVISRWPRPPRVSHRSLASFRMRHHAAAYAGFSLSNRLLPVAEEGPVDFTGGAVLWPSGRSDRAVSWFRCCVGQGVLLREERRLGVLVIGVHCGSFALTWIRGVGFVQDSIGCGGRNAKLRAFGRA